MENQNKGYHLRRIEYLERDIRIISDIVEGRLENYTKQPMDVSESHTLKFTPTSTIKKENNMKKELINLGLCKTIEIANQNPLTKTDIDYLKIGFTEGIKWVESTYTSIETIEDACTIVGYNDDNVALYHKCKYSDDITLPKKLFAILQLTIICKALNIFEELVNNSYWRPIFI